MAEGPTAPRIHPPRAGSALGALGRGQDGRGGGFLGIQAMWPLELENCAAPGRGRKSSPGQKRLFITRTLLEIVQNVAFRRSETSPQHVPAVTELWEGFSSLQEVGAGQSLTLGMSLPSSSENLYQSQPVQLQEKKLSFWEKSLPTVAVLGCRARGAQHSAWDSSEVSPSCSQGVPSTCSTPGTRAQRWARLRVGWRDLHGNKQWDAFHPRGSLCVEHISWNVFQQTERLEQSQGSQESNFHFLFHNN